MTESRQKGLIQIYTGNGKGKTTAALGLAMRAAGHGLKILFVQFIKGIPTGEHIFAENNLPFPIIQISKGDSFTKSKVELKEEAQQTLSFIRKKIVNDIYDLVILDEIFVALKMELITLEQLFELIDKKPNTTELILTGRDAPTAAIERADLVSEILMIKHPFNKGIKGRKGIEF